MTGQRFSLVPFPAPKLPEISIVGSVALENNHLTVQFSITGKIEALILPISSSNPGRKDDLWKSTCFEFFLAIRGEPDYWEFNISPAGDWNVYRMDSYRRVGFREEPMISHLPFEYKQTPEEHSLGVLVDLGPLLRSEAVLQMAVTAIIQDTDGNETYWALMHPGDVADFHRREGFTLLPAGQASLFEQSFPVD